MASTDPINGSSAAALAGLSGTSAAKKDDGTDRFLKLLVTQMRNQDPLNPMDNAQVTSQLAQINTVTGIERLNESIKSMSGQMFQSQALQGASLIGRDVLLEGNRLTVAEGKATAGFELASAADKVKVEILSPAGRVIDTVDLGAQNAGRNGFEWAVPAGASTDGLTFRVVAKSGAAELTGTPLMTDRVNAVSTGGDSLKLELARNGTTPYGLIKAIS
ncbi:flagellar hook assembly protein FlgD [Methylibium sp.]|uniref:flagellar hook assembly protein FlgD n=1 Tax=Methylibium sp. TaxID=2067992 RepID=UPI0017EE742A|nr:flagellar hook assembly protein FlgD [Methylibium sp.]MBA3592101.1 flagellar hook assembly protein FlgD [Methylibium sp.]